MLDTRFEKLTNNILHGLWEMDPVNATYLGIHSYDYLLPGTSDTDQRRYRQQLEHFQELLKEFLQRKEELSQANQIDLVLITAQIKTVTINDFDFDGWRRNPVKYVESFMYGLYLLELRDYLSPDMRLNSIISRLKDSVRFFEEGIANLDDPAIIPGLWTDTALQQLSACERFLLTLSSRLKSGFAARIIEISSAVNQAQQALKKFHQHLQNIAESCCGDFACGESLFTKLLQTEHMIEDTPDELVRFGHAMIEQTKAEMVEIARQIDPDSSLDELIDRIKADHPSMQHLVDFYQSEMERARDFVSKKQLATIPEKQELTVVATPEFQRSVVPLAAYIPPPPFARQQHGVFWVTPPDLAMKHDQIEAILSDHSRHSIFITAAHEAYPGHHLQLCHANSNSSAVRKNYMTSVLVEGWALYCEEMMLEQGFSSAPESKLMQLKDQLWRACRVVIDVELHSRKMLFEDAITMLVQEAGLDRNNAVAEVRRYTMTPTQPLSYLTGKREMMRLKKWWFNNKPDSRLCEFHDAVLACGSIPFPLIQQLLAVEE